MELAPASVVLSCEITYDRADLYVGMKVYDATQPGAPVLLLSPFLMLNAPGSASYEGKFTAVAGKRYLVNKGVYLDEALTMRDPDYFQGSESIIAENLLGTQSGCSLTGYVEPKTCPCDPTPESFEIFRGDAKTLFLKAAYRNGDPLNLSGCTEIDIALPNADGTFTHLLLTEDQVAVTPPSLLGKFSAAISSEISELLELGEFQNFDVTFTFSDELILTVRYSQGLSVFER